MNIIEHWIFFVRLEVTNIKQWTVKTVLTLAIALPSIASADPIPVTYEIGSYAPGGFSASYLHESTGCPSASGWKTGKNMWMCNGSSNDDLISITGSISGILGDDGILSNISGSLTDGTTTFTIVGGTLGAFGGGAVWNLAVNPFGSFYFESFSMGSGMPNYFDGNEMILWGQTLGSYYCQPTSTTCDGPRQGIDLYGKRVGIPEPGTLALFGTGLIGLGLAWRRRIA